NEHQARYSSCTHIECNSDECKTIISARGFAKCDPCRTLAKAKKYVEKEFKEWDEKTPVYDDSSDRYFFSVQDMLDYIVDENIDPETLMLVICNPVKWRYLDEDYFTEDQHEDCEAPEELAAAIKKVNEVVSNLNASNTGNAWEPSKYRTKIGR